MFAPAGDERATRSDALPVLRFRFPMRNREPSTSKVVPPIVSCPERAIAAEEATGTGNFVLPSNDIHSCSSVDVDLVRKTFQGFRSMLDTKNNELTSQTAKLQELTHKCRSQNDVIADLETVLDEIAIRDAVVEEDACDGNAMWEELSHRVADMATNLARGKCVEVALKECALDNDVKLHKVNELAADFRRLLLRHEQVASELTTKCNLEIDAKNILKKELDREIDGLRAKVEAVERDFKASNDRVSELECESTAVFKLLEGSEANVKCLQERLANQCNEILEIQETHREVEAEMNQKNDEMRLELETIIELQNVDLQDENDKYQLEMEAISLQLEEHLLWCEILCEEQDALETEVKELNYQLADQEIIYDNLVIDLEESETLLGNRSKDLEWKSEEMSKLQAELERVIAIYESKNEECESMQRQMEAAEKQIAERDEIVKTTADELLACKSTVIRLEAEIAESLRLLDTTKEQMTRGFAATIEKYKLDGERHANNIDGKLNEAQSQIASLTALINEKDAQLLKLVEEKSAVAREHDRITNDNDVFRRRLDEANTENATLKKNLDHEKDENERRLKAKNAENDRIVKDLKEKYEAGRRLLKSANAENDRLQKDLKDKNARIHKYATDIERLNASLKVHHRVSKPQASVRPIADRDAVAGILKRKADDHEPASGNGRPSKHVSFEPVVNSGTSDSDCLEIELIEPPASNGQNVANPKPTFLLRPSTSKGGQQSRPRTHSYMPKRLDAGDNISRPAVDRLASPSKDADADAAAKATSGTPTKKCGDKKRTLAKQDARLEWTGDDDAAAASKYQLLFDD